MIRKLILVIVLFVPTIGYSEPLRVFVSVLPQKTFVEKVGGDHVYVEPLVLPGHNPATYNLTPKQISALTESVLYIRIGVPFENAWMAGIRSANPNMRLLDARSGIELRNLEYHEHKEEHIESIHKGHDNAQQDTNEYDPHVWTSPPLVKIMARNIRDVLTELDPTNAQDYKRSYNRFAAELDTLDRDIKARLRGLSNKKFMVYHPAWGYFANTYGLTQVSIEKEGKEPGARSLTKLLEQARREQVKVIFIQPQFNKRSAAQVARAIGGRVVAVDPLSADYVANLRSLAQQIAETQK